MFEYCNYISFCSLYSCLANGSADEFQRGEHLYKARAVKELLQIGKYYNIIQVKIHKNKYFTEF